MLFSGISNNIKPSIDIKSVIINQNTTEINSWNDINETYIPDSNSNSMYILFFLPSTYFIFLIYLYFLNLLNMDIKISIIIWII